MQLNLCAGEYFSFDNIFNFLIVRNSGHLLPMDKPKTALQMIKTFIEDQSFADVSLPKEISYYEIDEVSTKLKARAVTSFDSPFNIFAVLCVIALLIGISVFGYKFR
jgi:hypothetical protein